ncbi:glycerol-3-phosphate responsive antiterminator [Geomicrobium sp. JCM 19039]|uniref:glycerol-3-phosphate responsive antiterminator n=1 Tax=Geomicrobium sp. JCM 19039 TaxID=1460636 RepID=UPI00045F12FB|nr:glycerol-3-phosphate responsive antiterminator [Geomicrobium sp. JCM 19039]GAK10459.1 glycerol uptake operon antiterminator regulatory protein [Geomicrobium sp. JCM 19039]
MKKTTRYLNDIVQSQVIAAISSEDKLDVAIRSESNVAFLLTGDIMVLPSYVERLKSTGMHVFVHLDFIDGLANDKSAIDYIAKQVKPTGIITTKSFLIKLAKKQNLLTIQRLFIIDRNAVQKGITMTKDSQPDAIEVLPGIIPKVIHQFLESSKLPIIAGGLVDREQEVHEALEAGVLAVSTGEADLWNLGV